MTKNVGIIHHPSGRFSSEIRAEFSKIFSKRKSKPSCSQAARFHWNTENHHITWKDPNNCSYRTILSSQGTARYTYFTWLYHSFTQGKSIAGDTDLTGATNLMAHYNLEHSYNKFSGKKFKDSLSSFLPGLPGMIDTPGNTDNSSLRSIIEKPPIGGKELVFLNSSQLAGFRLHPGPVRDF